MSLRPFRLADLNLRATIVTNMYPSAERPAFGVFVADQVEALRRTGQVELELIVLPTGSVHGYLKAMRVLRRRLERVDVVHAHFGLSAWPALSVPGDVHLVTLHGTDLAHPRSRKISLAALPWLDLVATVSGELAGSVPRWVPVRRRAVLPCGVDLGRFFPIPRERARGELGLEASRRYVLLPADPARPEKRSDRARALADAAGAELLVLGGVDPARVPLYVNAADAVLLTSDREGFGLGVLEALACDVPVMSTPVGIAPEVLGRVPGTLCAPFELPRWRERLIEILRDPDPRVGGRAEAELLSSDRMAARVLGTWSDLLAGRRS